MKTISNFLTALCAMVTFFATAQTVTQDTAWGGQMIYVAQAKVIIPDSTTVQVRTMWDFNSNFNNFTASAWKTYTNNSATADTVFTTDTMQMPMTGIFSVRYEVQKVGDTTSYFSGPKPVTVRPVVISPTIALNTSSANTTGGTQTVDYHAGFDNARLKVKLAFGTLTMNNGTTGTWQNATVTLTDSGTYTWAFGTYPSGTNFSYQFMFYNSVDTVYSGINGMTVVNGNLMHINQVDSSGATDSVITARTQVICNGTFTARTHIAYHNQSSLAHFDQSVTGNGTALAIYATFTNLNPTTDYDVWTEFVGTSTVGTKKMISTTNPIYTFSVTTDSVNTIGTKVRVYGTATVPSGEIAMVGGMRSAANDINFDIALDAPPMFQVTQGKFPVYQDFDFSTATADVNSRYKIYGYLVNGGQSHGAGIQHLYVVPTDTTDPLTTLFDSTDVGTTTVTVVFAGIDTGNLSSGVTNFLLYRNGTLAATLLSTQSTYTFTGLTANNTYTLGLQTKDDAGNFAALQTMVVTTDATATVPTPSNLTSITDKVCFENGGTWGLVTITGTNIKPGATYSGEYYDGQLPDVDSVMQVNTAGTECKVWIWVGAHFPQVTFTVTNPGAGVSNAITTKVDDCVATGVNEVARTDRKELTVFPNPVIDVTTIKIGQVNKDKGVGYQIFGLTGNLASAGTFFSTENTINLQQLPAGIYILKTSTGLSKKIVKQ